MFRLKYFLVAIMAVVGILKIPVERVLASTNCPELKIIFVRGSGGTRWTDANYLTFKSQIEEKLKLVNLEYEFLDLDYPAVGVGVDNLLVTLGAFFGAGEAYEFGDSVNAGVRELVRVVNSECLSTKYVVGGYSQGAMVVSKALRSLSTNKLIYAATFGDPKIYLPEGAGIIPAACKNENLSEYRVYVPDCQAYEGLLGSYRPYQPEGFSGKLGTWCNKYDIFCSSYFSLSNHSAYITDNLYEDASKMIFSKITTAFGIENSYISEHDVAFLFDTTVSMLGMNAKLKKQAIKLAAETLAAEGRVALYGYGDLADDYELKQYCDFQSCTIENFKSHLENLEKSNGKDKPESLLAASLKTMQELNWRIGSTKSLVIFTDAGFHNPDLDGTTLMDVVNLSKKIDPVNFYIVTTDEEIENYTELVLATDGEVVADREDEVAAMFQRIIKRFDSLPRVEESAIFGEGTEKPTLTIKEVHELSDSSIKIVFKNSGEKVMAILNEAILGTSDNDSIIISGLKREIENELSLIPLSETRRGDRITVKIPNLIGTDIDVGFGQQPIVIPKVPDTGRVKKLMRRA